jgi:hypothetical protein
MVATVDNIIESALALARQAQGKAFDMGCNWLIATELMLDIETMVLTLSTRPVVLEDLHL